MSVLARLAPRATQGFQTAVNGAAPGQRTADGVYVPLNTSADPRTLQAQVIEAQRADFNTRYRPIEDEVIAAARRAPEQEAADAAATAERQSSLTREQFMRDLARSGTSLTPEQRSAVDRKLSLSSGLSRINAYNRTYRDADNRNTDMLGDIIGIGRGVVSGAQEGLGTAASLANARESAGKAAKDQWMGNKLSSAAMGAGLALAGGFGATGAGIGALAGFLI